MNKRRRWKAKHRRKPRGVIPLRWIGQRDIGGAMADLYIIDDKFSWAKLSWCYYE